MERDSPPLYYDVDMNKLIKTQKRSNVGSVSFNRAIRFENTTSRDRNNNSVGSLKSIELENLNGNFKKERKPDMGTIPLTINYSSGR